MSQIIHLDGKPVCAIVVSYLKSYAMYEVRDDVTGHRFALCFTREEARRVGEIYIAGFHHGYDVRQDEE